MGLCDTKTRVLQVHPTLRCNLACRQCYSTSGPHVATALESGLVVSCLEDACELGYGALAVAGGEPLLWSGLTELCRRAKELGMRTALTTNGTLLGPRRLEPVLPHLDLVAVSIDGPPEVHDDLRGPGAWNRLERGLAHLEGTGVAWGVVYSIGRLSWEWLPDAAALVTGRGARLLQIHPLEAAGRAAEGLEDHLPDDEALTGAVVLSQVLGALHAGSLVVQLDLVGRERLGEVYATDDAGWPESLVLQADGLLVPYSYGLARDLAVCQIRAERLRDAWDRYQRRVAPVVEGVKRAAALRASESGRPFVGAYETLVAASVSGGPRRDSASRKGLGGDRADGRR